MTRVATVPLQQVMSGAIQRSQEKLAITQQQLASGKKATNFADLGTETVRNLSAGGMMADCAASFPRDERIEVELRGIGTVAGRIAWTAGGKIGVAFDHAIDPKLARKPVTGNPQPQLVKAAKSMWRPGLR